MKEAQAPLSITHLEWDGAVDFEMLIRLSDGQSITFHLDIKRSDPRFADVVAGKCRAMPKTDGRNVYWSDAFRLSFDEIMEMAGS